MSNVKTKSRVFSNVVKKKENRQVQKDTLADLKNIVGFSAGPHGSTTGIIKDGVFTEYTKDGHTILEAVKYNRAIEASIQKELTELTRHIVLEVGDGTTSAVMLSSLIFDELCNLEEKAKIPPYKIINTFKNVVRMIKREIKAHGRDLTLQDVYDIAMVSTNNNEEVARTLLNIYEKHGFEVFIDVGISNTTDTLIKSYDGLTLEEGYSDPVYINTAADKDKQLGYSVIRNASIYAFQDPIDTIEMTTLFTAIISQNIHGPYTEYFRTQNEEALAKVVPTVIIAPKISIDNSSVMTELVEFMYEFGANLDFKPPLLVISDIGTVNYEIYSDLWRLCGCKPIKKYNDPKMQERDIADGKAATPETVVTFAGHADEVKADAYKTTFINPRDMFVTNEEGEREYSTIYKSQLDFLEQQLEVAQRDETIDEVYGVKRRIHSLKANMVDYLVGGITVTDRDSVRALVEDAVKNIRSASKSGVGFGANFEALRAANEVINFDLEPLGTDIVRLILNAYRNMATILYNTAVDEETAERLVKESLEKNSPYNIVTEQFDGKVLSTIDSDITILDTISKIITVMFTSNQMLVQTPAHNLYIELED